MTPAVPTSPALPPVLDAAQLQRIENVHRGFFYQHLYAVGTLLSLRHLLAGQIIVERDEDIEVRLETAHRYIQVKTRSRPLIMSDIADALERFDQLRTEHVAGRRPLTPSFTIVTNIHPGPELAKAINADTWPGDVALYWPEGAAVPGDHLPPAWRSVDEALDWCITAAEDVAFTRLAAPTMVLKLAALVQHAAIGGKAGAFEHSFLVAELPDLLEQVVRELQQFPTPPIPYYSHDNEPELAGAPIRVIVGPSGAGKTAWAAHAAAAGSARATYFDAYETPANAFAPALARELAAHYFRTDASQLATILRPGSTGIDALRAVHAELGARTIDAVVVVDNSHRLAAEEITRAIQAAPNIQWITLAQPSPSATALAARLGVAAEPLAGWTRSTINTVLASVGMPATPRTAERVRTLTGGLPLFVTSLVQLAKSRYNGDVARLCDDLEAGLHPAHVAQEILLAQVADALSEDAHRVAGMCCLVRMAVSTTELVELADTTRIAPPQAVAAGIRELEAWGVVRPAPEHEIQLHEAFQLLGPRFTAAIDPAAALALRRALVDHIDPHRSGNGPLRFERAGPYLQLLADIGEFSQVIDIAAQESEAFRELGLEPVVYKVLADAVDSDALTPHERFEALDTLAFWDASRNGGDAVRRIAEMERLLAAHDLGDTAHFGLHMKRLVVAALQGDVATAKRALDQLCSISTNPAAILAARYNYAVAFLKAERWEEAEDEASDVALGFYDLLDLDPAQVLGRNPPELWAVMGGDTPERQDRLKRLADALDVYAKAKAARGLSAGLAWLHAHKFYSMSHSYQSAINSGIEVVQDFLYVIRSTDDARDFMERSLLPSVERGALIEHLVPVRALYAVVLAKDGQIDAARRVLVELRQFVTASDRTHRTLLDHRTREVEELAAVRHAPLPSVRKPPPLPVVGRNDPCPCGSGKKFKKCHGP